MSKKPIKKDEYKKLIIQGEKDSFNYDDGKKLNPIFYNNIQCKYCERFFNSVEDLSLHQEYDCIEEEL